MTIGKICWDVLGISHTTDPLAIRRAYGVKLRSLNVEADPAAFMALRAALERALQLASDAVPEPGESVDDDDEEDFHFDDYNILDNASPPESRPVYQPQNFQAESYNYHASGDRRSALQQILDARGVKAGWNYYTMLMARGDVALDDQTSFAMLVLERAVDPELLGSDDFLMIYKCLGLEDSPWRFDGQAALQKKVQNRVAALQWLAKLRALADKRPRKAEKYDVIAARLFLRRRRWLRSKRPLLEALTKDFADYHGHETWLAQDVDTAWLTALETRLHNAIRFRNRLQKLFVIGICVLVFGDMLVVLVKSLMDYFSAN